MELLGLEETSNSGAGWIEKGDGQSEDILAELKSTSKTSYRITKDDLEKVKHHAFVANKIPIFVIQFLEDNDIWLMVKPSDVKDLAKSLEFGNIKNSASKGLADEWSEILYEKNEEKQRPKRMIKSSNKSRNDLRDEWDSKWKKEKKSAT